MTFTGFVSIGRGKERQVVEHLEESLVAREVKEERQHISRASYAMVITTRGIVRRRAVKEKVKAFTDLPKTSPLTRALGARLTRRSELLHLFALYQQYPRAMELWGRGRPPRERRV